MLRSGLGLYAYTSPLSAAYPTLVAELSEQVEALELTTVAPGGFGDLACVLKLADARLPRPELGLFARVCLKDGPFAAFAGEWADPASVLDGHEGEYLVLSALGGGTALRDDPDESVYAAQTAQAIIAAEFAKRGAYLALDGDQALVLPSAPVATFSPIYDGFNLEEICHDLCFALGDYTWGVWDHATHRDAAGFPTWQLQVHPRDAATTHYLALAEDVVSWRVAPSAQRAYNVVQVAYVDVTGGPGTVTVSDTRLAGNGAQGSAPFRRRKLRRSLGRAPLTAGQATAVAQAWLAGYQNVTNKVEVELRAVRDAGGVPLPLHQVRADRNLYVPELAVRGGPGIGPVGANGPLASGPVAGVNQFYVVETSYRERADGDVSLTLQLDNYADRGSASLARLTIAYEAALRQRGTYRTVVSPGAPVVGPAGAAFSNATAGQTVGVVIDFPGVLTAAPSSVTLSATGSTNASGVGVSNITKYGFQLSWTATGNGATSWVGTYQTVGS